MASLVELATEIVLTRAKSTPLTPEEIISELNRYHSALKKLEAGEVVDEGNETAATSTLESTNITIKEAFKVMKSSVCSVEREREAFVH